MMAKGGHLPPIVVEYMSHVLQKIVVMIVKGGRAHACGISLPYMSASTRSHMDENIKQEYDGRSL